jgi:hypothetical protein
LVGKSGISSAAAACQITCKGNKSYIGQRYLLLTVSSTL